MRMRTMISCMVLAGAVAGVPAGGASPAVAQTSPRWETVAGNFFGDARDEEFGYTAGSGLDWVRSLSNGGVPGGRLNVQAVLYNVTRTLDPFAGDFDGDQFDELFWYAPGSGADAIWNFRNGRDVVSQPISVRGTYRPVVGDFNGDAIDDILWYAPGPAADSLWYFRQGGSHVSVPLNITSTYTPVVASIGKDATDDIVWYAPGTAADVGWDFTRGTRSFTTFRVTVNGAYRPIVLDASGDGPRGDDIWWYAPGPAADPFWGYRNGTRVLETVRDLRGNWQATVGDFFGDGQEDVSLWDLLLGTTLLDFTTVDGQLTVFRYDDRITPAGATASSVGRVGGLGDTGNP